MNAPKAHIRPDNADARVGITAETPDVTIKIRVSGEGKDGHTPQRGVDYWTEEDKEEIAKSVDQIAKDAVDEYLSENPPVTQITINGQPPDENNNFELKIESGEINNVIEF